MSQITRTDVLHPDSPASPVTIALGTAAVLVAAGSQDTEGTRSTVTHNGIRLSADSANTATVYVLLGPGTPSAAVWHIALAPGANVDVKAGDTHFRGLVQGFCAAAAKVGVTVV